MEKFFASSKLPDMVIMEGQGMGCLNCGCDVLGTGTARGLCRKCWSDKSIRVKYPKRSGNQGRYQTMLGELIDIKNMTPAQIKAEQDEVDRLVAENTPTLTETGYDRRNKVRDQGKVRWVCPLVPVVMRGRVLRKSLNN